MKIFFALILILSFAFGEHIRWRNDFDKVLVEAKRTQKDILLLILKKDCDICKSVFTDIFNEKEIQDKVEQKYVPVVVFFENKNSYPIELFYTIRFPALFFVSREDESFLKKPLFENFTKGELLNSL